MPAPVGTACSLSRLIKGFVKAACGLAFGTSSVSSPEKQKRGGCLVASPKTLERLPGRGGDHLAGSTRFGILQTIV